MTSSGGSYFSHHGSVSVTVTTLDGRSACVSYPRPVGHSQSDAVRGHPGGKAAPPALATVTGASVGNGPSCSRQHQYRSVVIVIRQPRRRASDLSHAQTLQ
jgi:hypothetical protein